MEDLASVDHHTEDQDEEEALSLRDLPLAAASIPQQERRSSSEVAELFEFLTNFNSFTDDDHFSSADQLISSGYLLPSAPPPPPPPPRSYSSLSYSRSASTASSVSASVHTRRSESLNDSMTFRWNNSSRSPQRVMMMRTSRSLDYRRLRRANSTSDAAFPSSTFDRTFSKRSARKSAKTSFSKGGSTSSETKDVKLPWYWLVSGLVKFPTEIEFKDIRNRQIRRNSTGDLNLDHHHRSGCKDSSSSWRLINVLSCKNHASVAVATPFHSAPHA